MSAATRAKARSQRQPPPGRKAARCPAAPTAERLQKVLATAGVGSRRQCEQLIEEGRVCVDSRVVTQLGTKVDPSRQDVRVDGEPVLRKNQVYFAVHKPVGVVSTSRDPAGRPRVIDLVPADAGRLFNVGRLDATSEGLILVTNDGELTQALTHPRYGVRKTYQVEVAGRPGRDVLGRLRQGVRLAGGVARVAEVRVKRRRKMSTVLEMVLDEGRNREIRRMLAQVGHKVQRLVRVAVGPVRLGNLPLGGYRPLTRDELRRLRRAAGQGQRQGQGQAGTQLQKGQGR